jgi:hypothetical protein
MQTILKTKLDDLMARLVAVLTDSCSTHLAESVPELGSSHRPISLRTAWCMRCIVYMPSSTVAIDTMSP